MDDPLQAISTYSSYSISCWFQLLIKKCCLFGTTLSRLKQTQNKTISTLFIHKSKKSSQKEKKCIDNRECI